jgi:ketosteroid isomerase-like protein
MMESSTAVVAADSEHAALNLAVARRYLAAVESREPIDAIIEFYSPDATQVELPNRLAPRGVTRGIGELREASARGREVMSAERYELRSAVAAGDRVALEVRWTGTAAVPLGSVPAGGELRAHFSVWLDFKDGKIVAQRNYDCFEEF